MTVQCLEKPIVHFFKFPHHAVVALLWLTTYNDRLHIMQGVRMEYSEPPAMAPCVTIAHEINMESPLYGLRQNDFELKVSPALLPEEWQPSCFTRISLHGSQEKAYKVIHLSGASRPSLGRTQRPGLHGIACLMEFNRASSPTRTAPSL